MKIKDERDFWWALVALVLSVLALGMAVGRAMAAEITGAGSTPLASVTCTKAGAQTSSTWTNNTSAPVYVVDGYVWIGENDLGRSDTALNVATDSGLEILVTNWDHYSDPVGVNDNVIPFPIEHNFFTIRPGGSLTLRLTCTGPYSGSPAFIQGGVLFHSTTVKP